MVIAHCRCRLSIPLPATAGAGGNSGAGRALAAAGSPGLVAGVAGVAAAGGGSMEMLFAATHAWTARPARPRYSWAPEPSLAPLSVEVRVVEDVGRDGVHPLRADVPG